MSLVRIDAVSDAKKFEDWIRSPSGGGAIPELHGYRSLSKAGRYYLSLSSAKWHDALEESSQLLKGWIGSGVSASSLQTVEVERDYGMEVREQAPQFFNLRSDARRYGNDRGDCNAHLESSTRSSTLHHSGMY